MPPVTPTPAAGKPAARGTGLALLALLVAAAGVGAGGDQQVLQGFFFDQPQPWQAFVNQYVVA